jgi:hypothetical protein
MIILILYYISIITYVNCGDYINKFFIHNITDRLCGLVVRVTGYRSGGPGSISGATRFSEKWWVWNGVHSASGVQLKSYVDEKIAARI